MAEEISYEYLFDLLRREKTREDLQSIDKHFYKNMFTSLISREKAIRQKELQKSLVMNADLERKKIEIKNIRKILIEIKDRRQKKIILLALSRARLPSTIINHELFTSDENKFFSDCVTVFRSFKQNTYSDSDSNKKSKTANSKPEPKEPKQEVEQPKEEVKSEKEGVKVQFLSDMPNFYGPKKELLGPFKKDDISILPEVIAKILVSKGRAKEV